MIEGWRGNEAPRKEGKAYKGGADGDHSALVAGLHYRGIDAFDGVGKGVEVTSQQLMKREVLA